MSALLWQDAGVQQRPPTWKRFRERWARRGAIEYMTRSTWNRKGSRRVYAFAYRDGECVARSRFRSVIQAEQWLENEVDI